METLIHRCQLKKRSNRKKETSGQQIQIGIEETWTRVAPTNSNIGHAKSEKRNSRKKTKTRLHLEIDGSERGKSEKGQL